MSTAGKVLVVLGMLASIAWPILATGVTQLNRNGNKALIDLADRVTKLEDDLKTTQDEIVKVKDETILVQKQMVRDLAVTGPRQTNMERVKSNREFLSRVQYQLATLQETVKNAEQSAQQRAAEIVAEQKTLDAAKAEVETLKVQNSELMNRLTSLRNELKTTLKASLDMLALAELRRCPPKPCPVNSLPSFRCFILSHSFPPDREGNRCLKATGVSRLCRVAAPE